MVVEILPLANSNKKVMDIRQGNTIRFMVVFKATSTTQATKWPDVNNVIAYAYTSPDYIVKFSRETKVGYNKLTVIDDYNLLATIEASQSKLMDGELMIELFVDDDTTIDANYPEEIGINGVEVGICITESLIKAEVV